MLNVECCILNVKWRLICTKKNKRHQYINFFSFNIQHTTFKIIMTYEPPIHWNDYEDIALKLYERFGDDFNESKIYRIRFTELLEWVLTLPNFIGKREESNEGHLEMIQSAWVYEWRDNQK
jgi:FeS assembly protein IscX